MVAYTQRADLLSGRTESVEYLADPVMTNGYTVITVVHPYAF